MNLSKNDLHDCLSDRVLQLIVMPTEACNFRCVYCYQKFAYGKMEASVVKGIKNLLSLRAATLRNLTLSWFGGEPLLANDVIEDILEYTKALMRHNPKLHLFSDITTNGYRLSRQLFERLLNLGVSLYQIPLDGPPEWHDKKRVLISGRGTFQTIWNNLLAMREVKKDFTIMMRLHVDRENYAALPVFIEDYRRMFSHDRRFKLFPRRISLLGGPNDPALPVFEDSAGREAEAALRRLAVDQEISHIRTHDLTPICYAARGNSFIVRANGRLNKCTIILENPINQVGRIEENGHVRLEAARLHCWMRGLISGDADELACPMHGYCSPPSKHVHAAHRKAVPNPPVCASAC